ncbi:TolC family protein [Dysgonomonas sp. Marseille-P4677]|uniref:TolC family protein n=1 Tax=Dysgonomonas sp. Marseille-P4677 TaxID=2364790 RepID=UPI00191495E2|nr:TolC family protein [Dysgonomonas sp. Marseille-P4677]MBK5721214.1 TolC family protein [Dysgonomonas sp. Marseille-P4677]
MKRIIHIILLLVATSLSLEAQNPFTEVLRNVEINNTTLKAYREQASADKIGNKTGINMANPEVEFGYLWPDSPIEENRWDFSINQSFDFPTAYRYKSQLAKGKNEQVDLEYEQQRKEILQQARLLCIELAYQNKMNKELKHRVVYAQELSDAYQKSFEQGNIDILERNKTKLDLLNTEKTLQMNEVEVNTLKSELQRMNGGVPVDIVIELYPIYNFPLNFIEWFENVKANNPAVKKAEHEVVLSKKQEQLTKALNLPKLTAGYARQKEEGRIFQGFTVGVSIPLWEGRNTVKHQKAQTTALQMQQIDTQLQFRNMLKSQYDKASKLSVLLKEYDEALSVTNNRDLLKKALDKGQLSLINYLLELSVYYETIDTFLSTERDYQLAVGELQQWEN